MPNQTPLIGPYFWIASSVYCEQVGVYRHEGGVSGEMYSWYQRIIQIMTFFIRLLSG